MLRVLFPTHLDKATNSTSIVLREIALNLPQLAFYSFSQPATPEDHELGAQLWQLPHMHCIRPTDVLRMRFDVVHHHAATARSLALIGLSKARSLGRCLHVFTATQANPQAGNHPSYLLAAQRADRVVALSRHVATTILEVTRRRADVVIPNGVDMAFFDPQVAQLLDWQRVGLQPPYVLFVGVLHPPKRPDIFLQLASLLPHLTFVLVGDAFTDELRQHYRRMAAEHPNAICLGLQPRAMVRDLMAQATALVFPSEREGMPLTVLEATAMGLPVLAQPRSSLPEVVRPGTNGWLLDVEQIDDWAQKVAEIAAWGDVERQAFARQARSFAEQNFSWAEVARQYRLLYTA